MVTRSHIAVLLVLAWVNLSLANEWRPSRRVYPYQLPSNGTGPDLQTKTIIGRALKHRVRTGESLLDIARHYHLGYKEIIQANPGVDPWVPPVGVKINIPSSWILPLGEDRGLVLNIPEMRLYYYLSDSQVMTFPLGIGMEGWDTPPGEYWIGEKRTNPVWYVPPSIQREMEVPRKVVPPGPDNPLGRHWMRLSNTPYGIHGTNNAWAVGRYVTHGCIRLYPEDIAYLFPRIAPMTPVKVIYQYAKVGIREDQAYFQVNRYQRRKDTDLLAELLRQVRGLGLAVDLRGMRNLLRKAQDGALIPVPLQ
ncbi:MAG: L,D-transpeptidase family protein [Candidatus Binatia bacterium]